MQPPPRAAGPPYTAMFACPPNLIAQPQPSLGPWAPGCLCPNKNCGHTPRCCIGHTWWGPINMAQTLWAHTKVLHRAHMVGPHQHGPNPQKGCSACSVPGTHEHAPMQCPMAACVWPALPEWAEHVWGAEKPTPPTPPAALCMLGPMPLGKHKCPPSGVLGTHGHAFMHCPMAAHV